MFQHLEHFTFFKAINAPNLMRSQLHSLVSLWKIRALSSNYSHNLKLKGYFRSKLFGIFIFEIFPPVFLAFVLGSKSAVSKISPKCFEKLFLLCKSDTTNYTPFKLRDQLYKLWRFNIQIGFKDFISA